MLKRYQYSCKGQYSTGIRQQKLSVLVQLQSSLRQVCITGWVVFMPFCQNQPIHLSKYKKIMLRWLDFQKALLGLRHGSNKAMSAKQKPAYFPASLSTQLPAASLKDCQLPRSRFWDRDKRQARDLEWEGQWHDTSLWDRVIWSLRITRVGGYADKDTHYSLKMVQLISCCV